MKEKQKALVLWSGGKDAALALHRARNNGAFDVVSLCVTYDPERNRVSMHDVSMSFIESQAESLGLKLHKVPISRKTSTESYRRQMISCMQKFKRQGFTHLIIGDIYLDDVKEWREELIEDAGLQGEFPLWQESTHTLMREFIDLGFRAVVVCTNAKYLDQHWLGRELDQKFLDDLPSIVDPCGEQGEYHTFVYDGPGFSYPIPFKKGEAHLIDLAPDTDEDLPFDTKFWYLDLLSK